MIFIFMHADSQANYDFNELKIQWERNIETIGDLELSPFDIERVYANYNGSLAHFNLRFLGYIDDNLTHEITTTFDRLRSDLHLAVQKGKQNYRHAEHERKIALIGAYGDLAKNLGINIGVLVIGILSAVVGQKLL